MKTLILMTLFASNVYALDCNKNPIACKIVANKERRNEKIDKNKAIDISRAIASAVKKHGVPVEVYTAILMQESGYKLRAKNCKKQTIAKTQDELMNELYSIQAITLTKTIEKCTDFGMPQIYVDTMHRYGFDKDRLLTDLNYSIEAGAIVLKDFMKQFHGEEDWWTRYNCGNKGTTDRKTCQNYKNLVAQYL